MKQSFEQLLKTIRQQVKVDEPVVAEREHENKTYTGWQYLYGEKETVSTITGIDSELLPPNGVLSKSQVEILANELEKILQKHHFVLDFPVNFPPHLRYDFIIRFWSEKHLAFSEGEHHIDFCTYHEETVCPFTGYCIVCSDVEVYLRSGQSPEQIIKYEDARRKRHHTPSVEKIDGWVKQLQAAIEVESEVC
ncbi:hypothetical protein [Mangrovibacterium diazotrophicum]|uniref:Uncharacterized protein n=1 Tax=Mangrovibacterium diazotrophicum TaxID=1261403 RepID=A0A419VYU3_9BACT|nr:hypothetical protein [Mangrovibacterium diazotrophicum]RKD88230.1 hypothetical protein BC643_3375 [Mangrovibacterium diazotrophicum]